MPHVQVRDLPDDVHRALVQRAERAGQSLQQYLTAQLVRIAETPTTDEVIDQIERRSLGRLPADAVVEAIRVDRDRR